jgi:hypothetical protein
MVLGLFIPRRLLSGEAKRASLTPGLLNGGAEAWQVRYFGALSPDPVTPFAKRPVRLNELPCQLHTTQCSEAERFFCSSPAD